MTSLSESILYVVATPIGNLRDISLRALDVLATVDMIAAEDTRTTGHLLTHYSITKKMMVLHQHNERVAAAKILALMAAGKSVALVTDAGTPGISDPGATLINMVQEQNYKVVPIPGPNAALCALSAAGINASHFLFYGFLSVKAGIRRRELEKLKLLPYTLVFYEAPHRILECISDLVKILGPHRQLTIARELTKLFETIHTCALGDALRWLETDPNQQRGEFVLLVPGVEIQHVIEIDEQAKDVLKLLLEELPLKQAVKLTAKITGRNKKLLYGIALLLKTEEES